MTQVTSLKTARQKRQEVDCGAMRARSAALPRRNGREMASATEGLPFRAARAARAASFEYPAAAEALQGLFASLESQSSYVTHANVCDFLGCLLATPAERSEWYVGGLLRVEPSLADRMLLCLDAKRRRAFGDSWLGMPPFGATRGSLLPPTSAVIAQSIVRATAEAAIERMSKLVLIDERWRGYGSEQALVRLFLLTLAAPYHTAWCCTDLLLVSRTAADDMLSCLDAFRRDPSFVQDHALGFAENLGFEFSRRKGVGE